MFIVRIAQLLRSPRRAFRNEGGFSLIEVMAALFIFTLLTLGLVPLLTSSIRGSNTARADTVGKNAALKAMERVRGLPYYVSFASSATKVDVLDLYYPDAANDISVGGRILYRVTCPWNSLANPACPRDVPPNYTIRFEAQFVDPVASGAQPTPGETATSYANVDPALVNPNYAWNSATADSPPRQILQMAVTASWTVGDAPESYTITSLLSDRSFGGRKIKGQANVGYGVDIYTAFDTRRNVSGGAGVQSSENAFAVTSESDIEGRRLSTARQVTTAARAELEREAGGSLGTVDAATSATVSAPPDQAPANVVAPQRTLTHSDFGNALMTGIGPTMVSSLTAIASSLTPSATGDSSITGAISGTTEYLYKKDPQLNVNDFNAYSLSTSGTGGPSLVSLVRANGLPAPLNGITAPATTGQTVVGGTRAQTLADHVYTQATAGFDRLLMLKSNWIPDPAPIAAADGGGTLSGGQGSIIVIDDFQAIAQCRSNSAGTSTGDARYTATLYYWEDPAPNSNRSDGRYRKVTLDVSAASSGADPLAAIANQNVFLGQPNGPLVYDHTSANQRIYLFGTTLGGTVEGGGGPKASYLESWNSLTTTARTFNNFTDPAGAPVSGVNASMDGAIEIQTGDLDTTKQIPGFLTVSLGSLSCYAEDAR